MCKNRILFYSHDGYGMGNIRRTLAICDRLTQEIPDLSILILTGSPMVHALRIPEKVDYVKLPCLTRDKPESFSAKYWDMSFQEITRFRSELILSSIKNFKPNLVVVDKKPVGIKKEFLNALKYIKEFLPETKIILGLRDILDDPAITIPVWKRKGYYEIIRDYYDQVWIYGSPKVFDAVKEYQMPESVARKVIYTGYLGRSQSSLAQNVLRTQLGLNGEMFTLVMVGGGGDGYPILKTYIEGMKDSIMPHSKSLLVAGPEMPKAQMSAVASECRKNGTTHFMEFSDEIEKFINVANVVVAMAGYNTVCELLSFGKRAVLVPRVHPVKEQYIRARRLADLGLVNMIHPDKLTKETLFKTIQRASTQTNLFVDNEQRIDLQGLDCITNLTKEILGNESAVNICLTSGSISHPAITKCSLGDLDDKVEEVFANDCE